MPTPTVQEFYQKHKTEILQLVSSEHLATPTLADMKYEFTSSGGKRYYSFTGKMDLPTVRAAKNMEFMDWFQNGLSPKDFRRIVDELINCMAHINANTKEAKERSKQAGLLLNEMILRAEHAQPLGVLVNFVANNLIREDEQPNIFSSQMHVAKCDELMNEIEQGNCSFFFAIPQLRDFSRMQSMSPDELMTYLRKLQTEEIRLQELLKKIIAFTEETKSDSKTSKTRS